MLRSIKAAIGYVAIVFAVGFLLGTLRVLVIAPQLGELLAVLIELPLMLATSWLACGWIIHRFSLPGTLGPRLVMGGVAFVVLMTAEIGVSVLAFGRTVAQHFETYQTAASLWGLLSQIAFALFPVVQLRVRRS